MEHDGSHLAEHAAAMASAAHRLAESTADPGVAAQLPAALAQVGEALAALRLAVEAMPRSLVPTGDAFEPACRRFEWAADGWAATYGCEAPSYERRRSSIAPSMRPERRCACPGGRSIGPASCSPTPRPRAITP